MKLEIIEKVYPNKTFHYQFWLGKTFLGIAIKVDGGYLVHGKRRPKPTEEQAAKQMIEAALNSFRAQGKKWRGLKSELRTIYGPLKG